MTANLHSQFNGSTCQELISTERSAESIGSDPFEFRFSFNNFLIQEEAIVLDYKKEQENNYPDEIKWDSTKIGRPRKIK